MAVSALPRTRRRASSAHALAAVSPLVLGLALVAPTLDLLARVIVPAPAALALLAVAGCALAGAALLVVWLRYPRTSWLVAASLASFASLAMRLVGADVAPILSLLTIVALGLGGAFTTPASADAEALLA